MDEAQGIASKINRIRLKLPIALGQGGKAFGSITTLDLAKAIEDRTKGLKIDRHNIELDKPIKGTGKFEISVKVHSEISARLRLEVIPEEKEEEAS